MFKPEPYPALPFGGTKLAKVLVKYRLKSDDSGFFNLFLAGAWTRNGMNVTCVEAATMSGMAAARAISGSPEHIVGENFMQNNDTQLDLSPVNKPAYVSLYGMAEESILPPGDFSGAKGYMFVLQADQEKLQTLANKFISDPTNGEIEVEVIGSMVMLSFLNVLKLTSPSQMVGHIPDKECSFIIPIALKKKGLLQPSSFAFWMPYVFIDNALGMVTGRESWGYFKSLGQLQVPRDEAPEKLVVETLIFKNFSPDTLGEVLPLLEVDYEGEQCSVTEEWQQGFEFCDWLLKVLKEGIQDITLLQSLLDILRTMQVPVVNLKQFRDITNGNKACYQALTSGPLKINAIHGGGVLSEGYTLKITPCASHQIIKQLGLQVNETGEIPIQFGSRVDFDFSAENGETLWAAQS